MPKGRNRKVIAALALISICLIGVLAGSLVLIRLTQTQENEQNQAGKHYSSNSDLRRRTSELAQRMRVFQQGFTQAISRLNNKTPGDMQERQAFYQSEEGKRLSIELRELSGRYMTEADQQFRSEALALRDEMERRLGRLPPYPRDRKETVWLDTNIPAGPSPFSWTADYLEDLARQLPP